MLFSLFKNAAIVRRSLLPGYTENAPGGFDKFRQSKCANQQSRTCSTEKTVKIAAKTLYSAIDISGRLYRSPSLPPEQHRIFHLVLTGRE
ncbi:unknown protein [Cronobacter turicensis z3032]|uniref:Uncharacterized protein n=1 Tax=Cronobacter turicensis (strain DSM 18703 / CCUG 55852 / LMG 23827 / z3032) TaxID=693216 RepID=C9XXX0_CROTZ|nr:unknown protein [Cronobacter turicensis z3032]